MQKISLSSLRISELIENPRPSTHKRESLSRHADEVAGRSPGKPTAPGFCERLNEEWITRFFRVEAKEQPILPDPQATILDSGGRIFFATVGERCVGCCALIRLRDKEFEVAKMAVAPSYQRAGIGRRLLHAAIEEGRNAGAQRLYLETNHGLTPAIRLHESVGFKHIDANRIIPSRYARADVYMELLVV